MRCILLLALLLGIVRPAYAEPIVLRAGAVIPEGSVWAHELHAFSRELESRTAGRVRIKWYLNAVAGGDVEMGERVRRGQLDFVASAGMLCNEVMPTMRVLRLPGLFQNRGEAKHVVFKLQALMAAEAQEHGFVYLGGAPMGADMFFLRRPVHNMAELRATRLWAWDLDSLAIKLRNAMGFDSLATDLTVSAARAFDDHRVDGFFALPTAALAFQWSIRAPYLLDYKLSFLFGCFLLSGRTYYSLSAEDQKALLTATAHVSERVDEVGSQQDGALLGGAFQHQGVTLVPVSESFRAELFAAANAAREVEGPKLVPRELIRQIQAMLADYRAEHQGDNR